MGPMPSQASRAPSADAASRDWCNATRFSSSDKKGFYESWFARANHPTRPLAFWIRYTVFVPKGRPDEAAGELWAIWFDKEADRIVAAKQIVPWSDCRLSDAGLDVAMGPSTVVPDGLVGSASHGDHTLSWDLKFTSPTPPILDFPPKLYEGGFPKAKALVGSPNAIYSGSLVVDGERIEIDGWEGSHNHNWGLKHTDKYGWAQVAGFDGEPGSFLECGAAKLKFGPLWTPWMAVIVLRVDGVEHRLNAIGQSLRNGGRGEPFTLRFDAKQGGLRFHGTVEAAPGDFVGLPYWDPPGGIRTCLNSKLARADFTLELPGQEPKRLISEHRAALEFLVDGDDHGVPVLDMPSPLKG